MTCPTALKIEILKSAIQHSPSKPHIKFSDYSEEYTHEEIENCLRLCQKERLVGVVKTGSDSAILTLTPEGVDFLNKHTDKPSSSN